MGYVVGRSNGMIVGLFVWGDNGETVVSNADLWNLFAPRGLSLREAEEELVLQ